MGRRIVPGDIIFCDRGAYAHFGIYVGNLKVIHFDSSFYNKVTGEKEPQIAKTSIEKFRDGDVVYTIEAQHLLSFFNDYKSFEDGEYKFYSPADTVKRAEERLYASKRENYSLLGNNCEHFAIWCKTGIRDSSQVRNFQNLASSTGNILVRHGATAIGAGILGSLIPGLGLVAGAGIGLNLLSKLGKEIFKEEAEY